MKRFKDKNLTESEWEEVFSFPKKFNIGDIVECASVHDPELFVWEVMEFIPYKKDDDIIYTVKNLSNGTLARFSSTFLQPIGTFIDDEPFTKGKI